MRELGDAVASSLTGNQTGKLGTSPNSPQAGGSGDVPQKGIVTVLDLEVSFAILQPLFYFIYLGCHSQRTEFKNSNIVETVTNITATLNC